VAGARHLLLRLTLGSGEPKARLSADRLWASTAARIPHVVSSRPIFLSPAPSKLTQQAGHFSTNLIRSIIMRSINLILGRTEYAVRDGSKL
jgi:hypothetical protein